MELTITDKKERKLLSRMEIEAKAAFAGSSTPSNDAVRDAIAKATGKEAKNVIVKHIYTDFGNPNAKIIAYVYEDEKKMKEIEEKRKKVKKDKKAEEKK